VKKKIITNGLKAINRRLMDDIPSIRHLEEISEEPRAPNETISEYIRRLGRDHDIDKEITEYTVSKYQEIHFSDKKIDINEDKVEIFIQAVSATTRPEPNDVEININTGINISSQPRKNTTSKCKNSSQSKKDVESLNPKDGNSLPLINFSKLNTPQKKQFQSTFLVNRVSLLIHRHPIWFGCILGLVPLLMIQQALFSAGFPFGEEIFSNLLPALHARHSLATGQLPIYTDLFYDGRYQFANPLWYGFYPPAWILFIPVIPMAPAIKFLIGVHLFTTPLIAYYFAQKSTSPIVAAPFALLWVLPIGSQLAFAHIEKVFALPWVAFTAFQLLPHRIRSEPWNCGLLAGIGAGAMFLAGGNYYFFYTVILIGSVALFSFYLGSTEFSKGAIIGGLVGAPHILSIVPTLLTETSRTLGYKLSLQDVLSLLTGLNISSVEWYVQGFAVIGTPIVLFAAGLVIYQFSNRSSSEIYEEHLWLIAVGVTIVIGGLMATGVAQLFPIFSIFRIAARATFLIAICLLLIAWFGYLHFENPKSESLRLPKCGLISQRRIQVLMALVCLISFTQGAFAWGMFSYDSQPVNGEAIADELVAIECDSVWLETTTAWGDIDGVDHTVAYPITKAGIAVRATHYGAIGQKWIVKEDGKYTFDALVTSKPIPNNGTVPLSKSDTIEVVGSVPVNDLVLRSEVDGIKIYEVRNRCDK
jgi:hypothetical protein